MIKIKTKDAEFSFSDYDEAVKFYNENFVHEMTCEIEQGAEYSPSDLSGVCGYEK